MSPGKGPRSILTQLKFPAVEVVGKYRLQGLELLLAGRGRLRVWFVSADGAAFQERHVDVDFSRAARQAVAQFVDDAVCHAGAIWWRRVARLASLSLRPATRSVEQGGEV